MLGQQDVGHRIVVRRIVGIREGRPLFSDALGELVELSETHLTLATAQGPLRVPRDEVHRAKRVPPTRRPTAAAVIELELAADEAWPAPVRGRLGGWLLRAADGWTGRANSALPVGDPDRPLPAAVDAVERWYAERGLPPMVNTPLPLAAPVGAELDARGWASRPPVLVQTAALPLPPVPLPLPPAGTASEGPPGGAASAGTASAGVAGAATTGIAAAVVELATVPSPEWLAVASGRKGGLPDAARHVLTAVDQVRFAHAYVDGALVGIGRGTVTGQGRWLGLSLVEVLPQARRQGLAGRLIRALAEWGAQAGATRSFLQVEQHNTGAVALYQRLGFTTHHTYRTRVAPH
ncbi:GNAT family N-acetyltransferase [Micromonospora costi]|uniref:GNAT family N-acetyltransferase n=1 Tax=Micromonospora costi TaxID=1530042 RepID=A0A3B0A3S2_9ACTN|nr:GNAT family N-acetyltransferase [Micromonospora costi]RKN54007.1 GNAT family N-acetyltransferase [Micromonospora costi]